LWVSVLQAGWAVCEIGLQIVASVAAAGKVFANQSEGVAQITMGSLRWGGECGLPERMLSPAVSRPGVPQGCIVLWVGKVSAWSGSAKAVLTHAG
jgi:hypothetical protein